jgi:hypothetical protein
MEAPREAPMTSLHGHVAALALPPRSEVGGHGRGPDTPPGTGDEAGAEALCARLPAGIARLINPAVLAARARVIRRKSEDLTAARVGRRRCAEIIANHLLEASSHAA